MSNLCGLIIVRINGGQELIGLSFSYWEEQFPYVAHRRLLRILSNHFPNFSIVGFRVGEVGIFSLRMSFKSKGFVDQVK